MSRRRPGQNQPAAGCRALLLTALVAWVSSPGPRSGLFAGQSARLAMAGTALRPSSGGPSIEQSESALQQGRKIWEQMVKAMGGAALKQTRAFEGVATVILKAEQRVLTLKQTISVIYPEQFRQVTSTPNGDQVLVINRNEGFIMRGTNVQPVLPSMINEHYHEQSRSLQYLLRYNDDPSLQVVAAGSEQVEGVGCQVLQVSFKGATSRLWVSPAGLVVKQSYQGSHPVTHAPGLVENRLSDYRLAGALQIPRKQVRAVDGREVMIIQIESFTANPRLDSALFQKPVPH